MSLSLDLFISHNSQAAIMSLFFFFYNFWLWIIMRKSRCKSGVTAEKNKSVGKVCVCWLMFPSLLQSAMCWSPFISFMLTKLYYLSECNSTEKWSVLMNPNICLTDTYHDSWIYPQKGSWAANHRPTGRHPSLAGQEGMETMREKDRSHRREGGSPQAARMLMTQL